MDKQRLQEIAGITPASQKLTGLINKAIDSIDENLSYIDLADAVAKILEQNYGTHNCEPFVEILKTKLNIR